MRCPDDSELAQWIDGLLPAPRTEAIHSHLQECLECRLVVGNPSDEAPSAALDQEARSRIPSFEVIRSRLRAAYRGEPDLSFLDSLLQEEPVLMAADTEGPSETVAIPSLYAEEGRLVVAFRTDPKGRVTAFFVSQDGELVRFRPLKVGNQCFLSDAEGRVTLSGLAADEVLGQSVSIPPVLASGSFRYSDVQGTSERPVDLLPPPSGDASARLYLRAGSERDRVALAMQWGEPPLPHYALVAIIGDRVARLLVPSEGGELVLPQDIDSSDMVRVQLIDLS